MSKQISPLRLHMLDDMAFRNMSQATQKCYSYAVACFARYHHTSPDKLGIEHVRGYRLHLLSRGLKGPLDQSDRRSLALLLWDDAGQQGAGRANHVRPAGGHTAAVLTEDLVLGLLKAERDPMMRTIFITIYAAGLRISEVIPLRIGDINSKRMVIHVRQAKGHKHRYVMLSGPAPGNPAQLLEVPKAGGGSAGMIPSIASLSPGSWVWFQHEMQISQGPGVLAIFISAFHLDIIIYVLLNASSYIV